MKIFKAIEILMKLVKRPSIANLLSSDEYEALQIAIDALKTIDDMQTKGR